MILLLVALISASTAMQGDVVNLTLTQPAHVILDDCMYFIDTLTTAENLTAGNYSIKITHSCLGDHYIRVETARGTQDIKVIVERDQHPEVSLAEMDREILELKRNVSQLQSNVHYYQALTNTLNSINVELYDRIKECTEKNMKLENDLKKTELMAKNCSDFTRNLEKKLSATNSSLIILKKENEDLKIKLKNINQTLSSVTQLSEVFKVLFFTTLAFLIGAYFSMLRR